MNKGESWNEEGLEIVSWFKKMTAPKIQMEAYFDGYKELEAW